MYNHVYIIHSPRHASFTTDLDHPFLQISW